MSLDFNGPPDHPFQRWPRAWLDRPLFEIFAETAAAHPDRIAIDDGDTDLTFGEVHAMARGLAARVSAIVGRGAPVGIGLPIGATYPVAMLGALAAGRPYVPIDVNGPEARNTLIARHSGMKAIIVDAATRAAVRRLVPDVPQIEFRDAAAAAEAACEATPDDVAAVIYTSGSTGQPKGVHHSQRNLVHRAMQRSEATHLSADDRIMLVFAPTVASAPQEIYASLLTGARLFVVDLRRKGIQEVVRQLRHGRVTSFNCVSFVLRELMRLARDPETFATVRHVGLSADRVFPADTAQFYRRFLAEARLSVQFGSTEAGCTQWFVPRNWPIDGTTLPVGYPRPDHEVRVVDEDGCQLPTGEVGRIVVASRYIALGYWNDEEATRRAFSVQEDGTPLFHGGDLGRFRPDGLLELVGREDRQVKIRGHRVEPGEVEAVIRSHPQVVDAAVIPRLSADTTELVAYAVGVEDAALSGATLSSFLLDRLPEALRPREVVIIDSIPKLHNFKHDIIALTEFDRVRRVKGDAAGVVVAPSPSPDTAVRAAVRKQWQRVLDRRSFEANQSWERAGGDSLKALEFVFELELALGQPVPMQLLGPGTRPSDLIASLEHGHATPTMRTRQIGQEPESAVFYLPGYGGPRLNPMRFVQALADDVEVTVIDYPPIDPLKLAFLDFDTLVASSVAPIRSAAAQGSRIRILGYSFGAAIGVECARVLWEEGHEVAFLGIIDASARASSRDYILQEAQPGALRPRLSRVGTLLSRPHYFIVRLVRELLRRQRVRSLAWVWWGLTLLPVRRARIVFLETAKEFLRLRAHSTFRPRRYPGKLVLFRATDRSADGEHEPQDLGWGAYCDGVTTKSVPGGHGSMFSRHNVAETKGVVLAALRAAQLQ